MVDKGNRPEAIRQYMQERLDQDLGDNFTWEVRVGGKELANAEEGGSRLTVIAKVDDRVFREFHVDVALQEKEILPPERYEGRDVLGFAGVPNPTYSITPNEAIFAEKIHAYTHPWNDRDNTRVKDIVDMNLLVDQELDKENLCQALEKVFESRELPEMLPPPPESWNKSYDKLAQQAGLELDLEGAYDRLAAFYEKVYDRIQERQIEQDIKMGLAGLDGKSGYDPVAHLLEGAREVGGATIDRGGTERGAGLQPGPHISTERTGDIDRGDSGMDLDAGDRER